MRPWLVRIGGAAIILQVLLAAVLYTPELALEKLKAKYAAPSSQFLDIDGTAIHLRDEGRPDGPVLLLVHGSNASLHVWEPWVHRLADTFRIVSFDLPGHGLTGPWPRDDYSVAAYAALTARIAERLEITRYAVAGHSMGGAVAWTLAAHDSRNITRLILIDAAAYPREGPPPLSLRLARTPVLGEIAAALRPRWLVARTLRQTYADPDKVSLAQVQRHHDLLRREGNRGATLQRLRAAPPLDPTPLRLLQVPTLILWGARDRWVPLEDARRLHGDIAGSAIVVYEDAGHVPMEEFPDRSAADARRFLLD